MKASMRPAIRLQPWLALVIAIVSFAPVDGAVPSVEPIVLDLWTDRPPGEMNELPPEADQTKPDDKLVAGRRVSRIGNVSTPQIAVYQPAAEKDTGAAVVICPGGGHHILAYDLEGIEVAQWLNSIGVTGIVLKYRVPFRDPDRRWQAAVQDAQRAMSLVRSRAAQWKLDPERIGICGFSAGGETAALTAIFDERQYESLDQIDAHSMRPDFAILVYPGGLAEREQPRLREHVRVPVDAPPMFFVHAFDDHVSVQNSLLLASAVKQAGGSAELHVSATGGHGYGLRPTSEAVTRWPAPAAEWLRKRGLLTAKETPARGHPADHLPPHIRQITHFGERAEFSHDSRRVLFVSKQFGDVMEYDIATGELRCLSLHFKHYGFNRAFYLWNGDLLLTGPDKPFDTADRQDRVRARRSAVMFVQDRDLSSPPVPLGYECDEGPAVSRTRPLIAWTHGEQDQISIGELVYRDGTPQLTSVRRLLDVSSFAERPRIIETQNFVPPRDDQLTVTAYQLGGTTNTDTFLFNLKTGKLANVTNSPDRYEECEGIFPDGLSTTVERNETLGRPWPLVDAWRVWFDGSREPQRLTHFLDFEGYKASNYVISDDGRWMAFQLGKAGDEAGAGYGLFLMDLTKIGESE